MVKMSLTDWPGSTRFLRLPSAFFSTYPQGQRRLGGLQNWAFGHLFAGLNLGAKPAGIGVAWAFAAHLLGRFSTSFSTRVENARRLRRTTFPVLA
jgi:hypothetical protein